jgi:6-phosphogluconolactonase (cycloisomerase 2 family)
MIKRPLITLTFVFIFVASAFAQAPSGVVYIESNIGHVEGQNSVLAYRRNTVGQLDPIGEYQTGGTGVHPVAATLENLNETLGPYDSDQDIILNRAGTLLFAVNSGSDSIAVFHVRRDGTLSAVPGSPFPSGGRNPISVGLAADESILVVVNTDYDIGRPGFDPNDRHPSFTTFRVAPTGKLIPVPRSTVEIEGAPGLGVGVSNPTQALVGLGGRLIFDANEFNTSVDSFRLNANGRLERVASLPTPLSEYVPFPFINNSHMRPIPLGLVAHPSERIFYAGFVFEGTAGVYSYDRAGGMQFERTVPAGAGICWLVMNNEGTRLYTSNILQNGISVIDTSDPLHPVKIQDFLLAGPLSGSAHIGLEAGGQYLYAIGQKALELFPDEANQLHVLRIGGDGRIVEETDRLVIPVAPSVPQGVAAR